MRAPPLRGTSLMKRVALYLRVSTADQCPESQVHDLRQLAQQRDFKIVEEYIDQGVSGTSTSRPALNRLMNDAQRGKFDVVMVWAFDRMARSVSHLIHVLDQLDQLGIEFLSFREAIDTHGPLGRAVMVILGAIAELERSLIVERVRAGLRRARLEGRRLGRRPLVLDRVEIARAWRGGMPLRKLAALHGCSRSTVQRLVARDCPKNPAREA